MSLLPGTREVDPSWRPGDLPDLRGVRDVTVDFETSGLRWFAGDYPVGMAVGWDDQVRYLPVAHKPGGNHDPDRVKEWAHDQLRDKDVFMYGAHFDVNVGHTWGIDFEAQGCRVHDVALWVALLDDHRRRSDLDTVAMEYLGESKVQGLDKSAMAEYHASQVADYAKQDVRLTSRLRDHLGPMISAEELVTVRDLEDECIYATSEMERNGAPIDVEKLERWVRESGQEYVQALWDIREAVGWNVNPNSTQDLRRLFAQLDLPLPMVIDMSPGPNKGQLKVSFDKREMARYIHPTIKLVRHARRLHSVRTKYLLPYLEEVRKHGVLRYALHQLRADNEGDDAGTISGRYSSSAYSTGDGANIQQVAGKKFGHSVKEDVGWKYNIRELFVPASGMWGAWDADQIEYRIWSHYARPRWVLEAYKRDPHTDFHTAAQRLFEQVRPITRELTKDCNFAGLFGAGLDKFAFMLDLTIEKAQPLYKMFHERIPEARQIYKQAMRIGETRGFVKTILGRRARFPGGDHSNAAINRVVQGSAADENKTKIVAVRKAKTGLKMRLTVHDELCGDVPDKECAQEVARVLNTQMLPCDVPLLWTGSVGPNWYQCKKVA